MTNDTLLNLVVALSYEVRDLMEAHCKNSGHNWHEEFMDGVNEVALHTK